MKNHLMHIALLLTFVAPLGAQSQAPAPSSAGSSPAPKSAPARQAAPVPAPATAPTASAQQAPSPQQPPQAARIQIKGRNGNGDINIEVSEAQAEKFREVMKDPDVQRTIERGLGRFADKSTEWRGVAALAMLVPLGAFALVGTVVWWSFRHSRERMQARMAMHSALLAKFNSGAEFTEFVSSKGGREYLDQLTAPQEHRQGNLVRSSWIGYVFTLMGAGMILVRLVEGRGGLMGGVVVLAIGVGHLMSVRAAQKMAERMGPQINSNGPTGGTPLSPTQSVG